MKPRDDSGRRRSLGILAILGVAFCATAAVAAVESPRVDREVRQQVVHQAGGQIKLVWQAKVPDSGIVFRVYRSLGQHSEPELLHEVPAVAGRSSYSVGDLAHDTTQVYELRIARRDDEAGREATLGSIEVVIAQVQGQDVALGARSASAACQAVVPAFDLRAPFVRLAAESEERAMLYWSDHPVPPPRAA